MSASTIDVMLVTHLWWMVVVCYLLTNVFKSLYIYSTSTAMCPCKSHNFSNRRTNVPLAVVNVSIPLMYLSLIDQYHY